MAKATKQTGGMKRQGRRVIPAIRRRATQAKKTIGTGRATLGDLIAAAFDTLGDSRRVARMLTSPDLAMAIQKRIVLV